MDLGVIKLTLLKPAFLCGQFGNSSMFSVVWTLLIFISARSRISCHHPPLIQLNACPFFYSRIVVDYPPCHQRCLVIMQRFDEWTFASAGGVKDSVILLLHISHLKCLLTSRLGSLLILCRLSQF